MRLSSRWDDHVFLAAYSDGLRVFAIREGVQASAIERCLGEDIG